MQERPILTVTRPSLLRGGTLGCGYSCAGYLRSDLKLARISSEKSCGCSQAAK